MSQKKSGLRSSQSGNTKPTQRQRTLFELFPAAKVVAPVTLTESSSPPSTTQTTAQDDGNCDTALSTPNIAPMKLTNGVVAAPTPEPSEKEGPPIIVIPDSREPTIEIGSSVPPDDHHTPPPEANRTVGKDYTNPIVIADSSPVKPKTPIHEPAKPAPRRAPRPKFKDAGNDLSAWPDAESQHVKGEQISFCSSYTFATRNTRIHAIPDDTSTSPLSFLVPDLHQAISASALPIIELSTLDDPGFLDSLPSEHKSHPAIHRILNTPADSPRDPQEDWTRRWRPIRAAEVLGNETQAIYIRDWLRALEVKQELQHLPSSDPPSQSQSSQSKKRKKESAKGSKRPNIVRSVSKRNSNKRRKLGFEDDDWIDYSDDVSEAYTDYGDDDDDFLPPSQSPYHSDAPSEFTQHSSPPALQDWDNVEYKFETWLTNNILLCGPPGCGKTAAVYACAAELGWEVFEVYPGIGRRNGASVDNLVGDVGKNHLVHQHADVDRESDKRSEAVKRFFTKTKKVIEEVHQESSPPPQPAVVATSVQQSVILLEEVDILFQDDVNFWPAVIDLIKACRRPVILTCNDSSLVPMDDLPLQTILTFNPCPTPLASSFLRSIAWAEGHPVSEASVSGLYESKNELNIFDIPDMPLHPLTEGMPVSDLRQSIHNLQLLSLCVQSESDRRGSADKGGFYDLPSDPRYGSNTLSNPRPCGQILSEYLSYMDSFVVRSSALSPWGYMLNSHQETSPRDDEIGHGILKDPTSVNEFGEVGDMYEGDMDIANFGIALARGGTASTQREDLCRLFQDRTKYQSRMLTVLQELMHISSPLMPRGEVFTDYTSGIRNIVAADDAQEQQEGRQHRGRRTRNRMIYERTLELKAEHREILETTGLTDRLP